MFSGIVCAVCSILFKFKFIFCLVHCWGLLLLYKLFVNSNPLLKSMKNTPLLKSKGCLKCEITKKSYLRRVILKRIWCQTDLHHYWGLQIHELYYREILQNNVQLFSFGTKIPTVKRAKKKKTFGGLSLTFCSKMFFFNEKLNFHWFYTNN